MQVPDQKPRVVRFGAFEVDLQEVELRKSGIRIKLQEQPFQVLNVLLRHSGETVTREELRSQALVRRHLRRFRPQPEHLHQEIA
jgi:DNA-binding response OmpR family regulator